MELSIKEAVKIIRESDISKGKYNPKLAAAEMKVLDYIKSGWKVVPPKSWHKCYISDHKTYQNLQMLCISNGIKYEFYSDTLTFSVYCSDHKWKELATKVNIYVPDAERLPNDVTELMPIDDAS